MATIPVTTTLTFAEKVAAKKAAKEHTAVRTHRFEIVGFKGDPKEIKQRWRDTADDVREVTNLIWQTWELYHVSKGNDVLVRQFAADLRAYRQHDKSVQPKPQMPKNSVFAVDPAIQKHIYNIVKSRYPHFPLTMSSLIFDIIRKRMTGKDTDGRWPIWIAIMLNRQGRPNSSREQPIPFSAALSRIHPPANGSKNFALEVKVTRGQVLAGMKNAKNVVDHCELKARGNGTVILDRIVTGKYKFCGSSLIYDQKNRKWFGMISYSMPIEKRKVGENTAILFPARTSPFVFLTGKEMVTYEHIGNFISNVRQTVLTQRWSRQRGYRYGGPANKGHGRKRALSGVDKLSMRWKHACTTANQQLVHEIVEECIKRDIGYLKFMQPVGEKRDTRMISNVGKIPNRFDSTGWEFAQTASKLQYKCQAAGIKLEIVKIGE